MDFDSIFRFVETESAAFYNDSVRFYATLFVVGSAIIIVTLERIFPYKEQKFFRKQLFSDFFLYTIFQSYVLGLVFSYLVEWIDTLTNIRSEMILADVPVWLLLFISLIVHDFYIYWFHKAQHLNNYLWRIHEAHHSTQEMDWLSGSRSHAFEILINQTIEFGFLILLGAPPAVIVLKGAISAVWGMWIHANVDVNTGKLQYIINGPEMHRWHHVDKDPEAFHKNYATKFAFWDWMFGTAYLNREKKLKYYGISNPFPENYFGQFIALFRKFDFEKEILIDKKTGKHNKSLSS